MSSSSTLDVIIPILLELANNRSPISQAVSAAIKVNTLVKMVKSDRAEYAGLGEDGIKLLYVVEQEWREKLNALTRILGKISELAKGNAAMSDVRAFWNSDEDELRVLREELQQLLPAFGVLSFDDLEIKSSERIKDIGDNTNQGITANAIKQRDDGRSSSGAQFLPSANNPTITGGEFNIVGRDYNSRSYGAWY
ncbi:hypothetical protein M378DRAFT_180915 [Amanita muscaria Koide BX008]|uniref:Uncharacterized protein n=1 Tax=Amanita muscaria (strain Koide BX008) TaxID=946122 RepID=A0A0C2SYG2_AMAMK|nr:hypothetical protein M378DRAFT_180915 [Amanita muscaria Koide BX008]